MITGSKTKNIKRRRGGQNGFSMPELLVVILVISILVVLALPQLSASRRAFRFAGMQRQIVATLNEARQEAMSQRAPVSFRYDDAAKRTIIYGGRFGAAGDAKNKITELSGSGLNAPEIVYGRPGGVTQGALADTTNLTALSSRKLDVTFQSDGSVVDVAGNPANNALYFYNTTAAESTAFAVSVLGAGGRVKLWRYSKNVRTYIE